MSNFWNKLLYHEGQGWWDLPRTRWQDPNPPMEGPFGDSSPLLQRIWDKLTGAKLHHGTPGFYVLVGFILSVITIVEVWAFAWTWLGGLLIPVMLILSLMKFVLVVGFYMHLRFDHKMYSWVFTSCMVGGVALFVILLILFAFAGQTQQ